MTTAPEAISAAADVRVVCTRLEVAGCGPGCQGGYVAEAQPPEYRCPDARNNYVGMFTFGGDLNDIAAEHTMNVVDDANRPRDTAPITCSRATVQNSTQ